ncbi:hypothetical protein BOX15_Mlig008781g4, partial [Macrostomum lignano]
ADTAPFSDMTSEHQEGCKLRFCDQYSAGTGPLSGLPLCPIHLDKDIKLVDKKKTKLMQKLDAVVAIEQRLQLRAEQSSLAAELQEVSDAFDSLQAHLQQWRERTMSRVQAAHDSVAGRLRDAAEAEECSKEVSLASNAGDWKSVAKLVSSLRIWVDEACERTEKFDQVRSEIVRLFNGTSLNTNSSSEEPRHHNEENPGCSSVLQSEKDTDESSKETICDRLNVRSIGDISLGVRHLEYLIDRHMNEVNQLFRIQLVDANELEKSQVCRSIATIDGLPGQPGYLAVCTNTAGFMVDTNGRIIRSSSQNSGCLPLPEPCLFISFYVPDNDDIDEVPIVDHILVASLDDGGVYQMYQLRLQCDLDWNDGIWSLHCDSPRQLLYVALETSVLVADLSGKLSQKITVDDLPILCEEVCCIDGDADKLFILTEKASVATVCKESSLPISTISISALVSGNLSSMSLIGRNIALLDYESRKMYVTSSISGQLLSFYPTSRTQPEELWYPHEAACDDRGLVFQSDSRNIVRVLDFSGTIVQNLGRKNESGCNAETFNGPDCLLVVQLASGRRLFVSDVQNQRIRVFEIL